MAIISFTQGEDKKVPIEVIATPAIDFTTAIDIYAVLFVGTTEQYKYSKNALALHGKLVVDGANFNKLHVFVERENSIAFNAGSLSATVIATFTNAEFPDGKETKTYDVSNVARVLAGRALDETVA